VAAMGLRKAALVYLDDWHKLQHRSLLKK